MSDTPAPSVQGSGVKGQGAVFRVEDAGCRVFRVWSAGFRVQGSGFRVFWEFVVWKLEKI